jgi:hypothetical protein
LEISPLKKNQYEKLPCAYCGRYEGTCHGGHLVPNCMYPEGNKVEQLRVPECPVCKAYWQNDDAYFRDVIVMCGEANELANEKFFGPISRSFTKPSGPKWRRELGKLLVPVEVDGEPRHKVYPLHDERVVRVLKRIIRGLCHLHSLGTCITEAQVWASVFWCPIPPAFQADFKRESLSDDFCWYEYSDCRSQDDGVIHSAWVIEFYGRTRFFCLVSTSARGWAEDAA